MGRILSGRMFKETRRQPRVIGDDTLRKAWLSPGGVETAAKLAVGAGQLIGSLPNPFAGKADLSDKGLRSSSSLLKRAAARRSELTAGDRYSVAQKMERDSRREMRPQIEAARAGVQEMGGAELATPQERQAAAGFGSTPPDEVKATQGLAQMEQEARDRVAALQRRTAVGESPDPSEQVTEFNVLYENLADPEKRKNFDQATLEEFYQGVSSGGVKRDLLEQGAAADEVNAAQELAQMELSRRAQGPLHESILKAEDVVDVQTGEIAPGQVERFDETIIELDPVYRGLVGLTRDEARSKILIAARVADKKGDQDLLRKQWEMLDTPRETIGDLFKSSEQIQREHRKELEDRFAKLRWPGKGVSAKDMAQTEWFKERTKASESKRLKDSAKKGSGKRGAKAGWKLDRWDKFIKEAVDDVPNDFPALKTASGQLKTLQSKLAARGMSDEEEAAVIADIKQRKRLVAKLNKVVTAYRQMQLNFRGRIANALTAETASVRQSLSKKLLADLAKYHVQQRVFERDVNRAVRAFGTTASVGGGNVASSAAEEMRKEIE